MTSGTGTMGAHMSMTVSAIGGLLQRPPATVNARARLSCRGASRTGKLPAEPAAMMMLMTQFYRLSAFALVLGLVWSPSYAQPLNDECSTATVVTGSSFSD